MPKKSSKIAPIHRGEILKDLLAEAAISANAAAAAMHIPTNRLTQIMGGRRSVTGDTALRLARYFGNSPQFWMNLQSRYELDVAEDQSAEQIDREVQPLGRAS